ncbi:hypothetical protein [Fluviicola sp.]|uniref:hypothetical protein n=1 Tax=Fluviicola sp. TaxID=1917219 RepID=UPI0026377784|nr:hypothetical protein [Fluviicola sp.]
MDDSVCILKIDHEPRYEDTYKTGFYKIKADTFYFSDISAGFHYITKLEFTRSENLHDDSLEIELFIAAPTGSGWTHLDSLKFIVNGLKYPTRIITPSREDNNKRSHFIKVKRPLSKQIVLSAYAQDSSLMIYKPMYFLNDLCLHNSYINNLYIKMVTFLNTEGAEIPLSKLLPETVIVNSKVYKVRPGK